MAAAVEPETPEKYLKPATGRRRRLRAVHIIITTLQESQSTSRSWRVVRFVGVVEANAAYSECDVKLADNGSFSLTS